MLGQDQFHVGPAHTSYLRRVGEHHHSLFHRTVAGCDQLTFPLHFHHADLAGTDFINIFQKTQMRHFYSNTRGCTHNTGSFRHL